LTNSFYILIFVNFYYHFKDDNHEITKIKSIS